jgi:hypothetical protein
LGQGEEGSYPGGKHGALSITKEEGAHLVAPHNGGQNGQNGKAEVVMVREEIDQTKEEGNCSES